MNNPREVPRGARHGYRGQVILWRAADDDYVPDAASFSPDRETAVEYTNNPGYGGRYVWRTVVEVSASSVLNLYHERDPVTWLAHQCDLSHPGAINAEEWIPMTPALQECLRGMGYDWIVVKDSFPQGAETWLWIGPFEREPELTRETVQQDRLEEISLRKKIEHRTQKPFEVFWRIQSGGFPLSRHHRSSTWSGGHDEEQEIHPGTSAVRTIGDLEHANALLNSNRPVDIVKFAGYQVGRGFDGEPIVIPEYELLRLQKPFSRFKRFSLRGAQTIRDLMHDGWYEVPTLEVL